MFINYFNFSAGFATGNENIFENIYLLLKIFRAAALLMRLHGVLLRLGLIQAVRQTRNGGFND